MPQRRAHRAGEQERLVVVGVQGLEMVGQLSLMMSENGTVRRPAMDLGGPNADPPPSCSMS
jgi:hypothetical protein